MEIAKRNVQGDTIYVYICVLVDSEPNYGSSIISFRLYRVEFASGLIYKICPSCIRSVRVVTSVYWMMNT